LIGALVVDVEAEVDVEPAVAVVVGDGCAGERALWFVGEMERVWLELKFSVAVVEKQQRAACANDDRVLASGVGKIGEERAGGVIEEAQAGAFGDVFESAVAAISKEAIGQAGGLADVEIVEAVAVDVGERDAVVAVDIDAGGAVENGAPVIDAGEKLSGERRVAGESLLRDVGEYGRRRLASRFVEDQPLCDFGFAVGGDGPRQIPIADAMFAVKSAA
jgi:hypothetical protein